MSNYKRMQRKTDGYSSPKRRNKTFYNGLIRTRVKQQDRKDIMEDNNIDDLAIRHAKVLKELKDCKKRLRETAQTLIDEIGSIGPENAESAAIRAVEYIKHSKQTAKLFTSRINGLRHTIEKHEQTNQKLRYRLHEKTKENNRLHKDYSELLERTIKPKEEWPEDVIVVERIRPVKLHEEGEYWFWTKNNPKDEKPMTVKKTVAGYFNTDFIYKKRPPVPERPEPIKKDE